MIVKGAFPVRWAAEDGKPGTGVTVIAWAVKYCASTQGTSHPTSGWQTTIPKVTEGNYLWTWTHVDYSDGTSTDAYSVSRMGIDGKGIQSSSVTYSLQETNVSPESITTWGAFPSTLKDGWWLYTKTHIVYSDSSSTDSYSVAQVGVGAYYAGIEEHYCAGDSATKVPDGSAKSGTYASGATISTTWSQTRPKLTASTPYLWNQEISSDSRGNRYVTEPRCIGNFAKGIVSIVETYAISAYSSSSSNYPTDITSWTDEAQDAVPTESKPYQWNKTVTTYNDGTSETTYHVSAVKGINGKGAAYIDLDNENDSMLYDQQGSLVSGNCTSNIVFYDNGQKASSQPSFSIKEKSAGVSASVSGSVLTVTGITSQAGYVIVHCYYNNVEYMARMTIKRIVGTDKYELSLNHTAVSYNTSDGTLSNSAIIASVYRTPQNGTRTLINTLSYASSFGLTIKVYPNGVSTNAITLSFDANGKAEFDLTTSQASSWNSFAIVLFKDGVERDRETMPINKVSDGPKGTSISELTTYFLATDLTSISKDDVVSGKVYGWSLTFPTNMSTQKPYVWKYILTTYTNGDKVYSTPELVTTYYSGDNNNLLGNAAFVNDDRMSAWSVQGGSIMSGGKNNRNFYRGITSLRNSEANCKEILQQLLYNGSTRRIKPSTWYTLSYWSRQGANDMQVHTTSSGYGFATQNLYLFAGHTYTLVVNGCISAKSSTKEKYLRVFVYNSGWTKAWYLDITSTSNTEKQMNFTPDASGEYFISAYLYPYDTDRSTVDYGTVTVNTWRILDATQIAVSYIYPTAVDTTKGYFIDGVRYTDGNTDLHCYLPPNGSWDWERHVITFKTKSSFEDYSDGENVLFRLMPSPMSGQNVYLDICMPKLEEGMFATGFIDSGEDAQGLQGVILRDSIWQESQEYHNDSALTSLPRYLDITYVQLDGSTDYSVFECKKTHISSSTTKPGSGSDWQTYWRKLDNMGPLYTPLLIAKNAKITFGQTNQLLITNSKGKIQGCFGGVDNEQNGYPLWIGGETASASNFRVQYDGTLEATGADIKGVITATKITADSGTISGFELSGNGLTNIVTADDFDKSNDMGYIICRNDKYGRFAGIGANVLPASSGATAVARFENNDTNSLFGYNIAMILEATGQGGDFEYSKNIACATYGGAFTGFALGVKILDSGSTSNKESTLDRSDNVVTLIGDKQHDVRLPTMHPYDDGHILIIKRDGNCPVYLHPGYYYDKNGTIHTTYLRYDKGSIIFGTSNSLSVDSWMDSAMFIFHAFLSVTNSGTTYQGCWMQYKLPRDW